MRAEKLHFFPTPVAIWHLLR